MPAPIPDKIPCEGLSQFEEELQALKEALSLAETEETWDRIERALARFTAVVKGGGSKFDRELVDGLKLSGRGMISAMNSERTRLAVAALECLGAIAPRIGVKFEPLVAIYIPPLLRLSTRTNKVYVTRSQSTTALIIGYCQIPSIVPHLLSACKESKMATGRLAAAEAALRTLNKWDWTQKDVKAKIGSVEELLKITGRDKDSAVRQTSKMIFGAYKALFPERIEEFTAPLSPTLKKYLDIKPQEREPAVTSTNLSSSTSSIKSSASNALKLNLRGVSSHAIVQKSKDQGPSPPTVPKTLLRSVTNSMLPPAIIPSRSATVFPSRDGPSPSPSEQSHEQRQRVTSDASSTFSVKSAPSNSRPGIERKPPVRLASSQSRQNPMPVSSGPARRVRRVISIEPHPANRSDLFAAAQKAVIGVATRPGLAQISSKVNSTISFPGSGGGEATLIGRKGPQRVLKPAPPPPLTVSPSSSKTEDAAQVAHVPKRETKISVFPRGVPEASDKCKASTESKQDKPKEKGSFIPRRGGLTQPTLSQLNKQRTRVTSVTAAKKSVVNISKPSTLKMNSKSRAARARGVSGEDKEMESAAVSGAIVPLPHLVPLPASPKTTIPPEKPETVDEELDDVPENVATSKDRREADDGAILHAEQAQEVQFEAAEGPGQPNHEEVRSVLSTPTPQTPPFPAIEDEGESHELDHIEFTKGEVYDSAGMPVKTPRKIQTLLNEDSSDGKSLEEVILDE